MKKKQALKPRDRFSYKDGYGYFIGDNQAILITPKKGRGQKYAYVAEIPASIRHITSCSGSINLAFDSLDLLLDQIVCELDVITREEEKN